MHGAGQVTGEHQFAATLMGANGHSPLLWVARATRPCRAATRRSEGPVGGCPRSFLVAANWHSPPPSERWQVHGTGKVTGEHQFAAT
ncbi:MAG: hypothetical protein ACYDC1_15990, partial [Limisphaerales bacterium]